LATASSSSARRSPRLMTASSSLVTAVTKLGEAVAKLDKRDVDGDKNVAKRGDGAAHVGEDVLDTGDALPRRADVVRDGSVSPRKTLRRRIGILRPMRELTIYLCRHGDTAWSGERRLAGRTDLPLTERGEENARQLGRRLAGVKFERVLVSPLVRARRTAELAGIAGEVDARIVEMDFGRYEGRTMDEIRREVPGWTYLRDGCPGGEGPEDVGRRADLVLGEIEGGKGNVALFAHSVILRVLAARYLGLPAEGGRHFMLSPGAVGVLAYDHVEDARAIASWNERSG